MLLLFFSLLVCSPPFFFSFLLNFLWLADLGICFLLESMHSCPSHPLFFSLPILLTYFPRLTLFLNAQKYPPRGGSGGFSVWRLAWGSSSRLCVRGKTWGFNTSCKRDIDYKVSRLRLPIIEVFG
ncbi:hypothetical protein F4810DRAFT_551172 [Camillea tinctor]|nr:hypothetical protein F4810DRAFT_551172 [Camillea tinctor]